MISRILVASKEKADLVNSYLLVHSLRRADLRKIGAALTNPTLENFYIDTLPALPGFSYAIEIGYEPGVTDNIAHTVGEMIGDLLRLSKKRIPDIYSSRIYLIKEKIHEREAVKLAESMHNPLIERAHLISGKNGRFLLPREIPKVILKNRTEVIQVSLDVSDQELERIGKEGIQDSDSSRRGPLALDVTSMKAIQAHFFKLKRAPYDIELESLAQTWSEHCKHTIFANPIDDITDGLYKTYIKGATSEIRRRKGKKPARPDGRSGGDFCVSVFSDNSGAIAFDDTYLITHKVETHNSPSALDPFGGAITGIVGVNRDTMGFGLGAKPVANVYGFCLSGPEDKRKLFRDQAVTQPLLSAKRIMDGVIKGINVGGNCSGIPTPHGFIKFDTRYGGKPLVFAGTVGLIPRKVNNKPSHIKKARAGDYIVMLGGRVGLDGIHGATFSSIAIDAHSPSSAVQIGDPITQKKLSDAIVKEARDAELYHSITDNGAGGLSCSVAEMAKECGGAEVDIEKVPLKYPGLRPWEIWISESQERMTLAVSPVRWEALKDLMNRRGVEATVIGKFTNSGKVIVRHKRKKIMDMDMKFLHEGLPKHHLRTAEAQTAQIFEPRGSRFAPGALEEGRRGQKFGLSQLAQDLEKLIASPNVRGFSFVSEQYDHEVQAGSVLKPLSGPGRINTDAQIFRPVIDSKRAVVLSSALYPSYGDVSAYHMAAAALDTAVRNAVAAGGTLKHLAILDNFCWSKSGDPGRLRQLVEAVKACYEYAIGYGTPFISGKDSMWNDLKGFDEKGKAISISVPPTLLISAIGVMPDFTKAVSPEWKQAGDIIYLLGETNNELGGGEYYKMYGQVGAHVPKTNWKKNLKTYKALEQAIKKELAQSSLSVASGGLGIALAKASLGGMLGCEVSVKNLPGRAENERIKLFSESQGRILVSVSRENTQAFEKIMRGVPYARLGKVGGEKVIIRDRKKIIETAVSKLYKNYHSFSESRK